MPTTQQLIPESQNPNTLSTVAESTSVQEALSLMIEHDFSQLPVVDEDFKLKGLITSDSILKASSYLKCEIDKIRVSHAMLDTKGCRDDEDIAEVLKILSEANSVPIVDKDGKLVGILTSYDTTQYYRQRAEDIMFAEDIEMTIRQYIQSVHTEDELKIEVEEVGYSDTGKNKFKKALNHYLSATTSPPARFDQTVCDDVYLKHMQTKNLTKNFEDLTLHEYLQIFRKVWKNHNTIFHGLEWKFVENLLNDVREIRNAIAHFREVTPNQRKQLEFCISLLDRYRSKIEKTSDETVEAEPVLVFLDKLEVFPKVLNDNEFATPVDEVNESRYSPFASYLANQVNPEISKIRMDFHQIEEIIKYELPNSARSHRTWWSNDPVAQPHSEQWLESGWRISNVNVSEQKVTFVRIFGRQISYINFFASLSPKLSNIVDLSIETAVAAHGRHWSGVKITSPEVVEPVWISLSFARKSRFRIELYIDTGNQVKNKKVFDMLDTQKNEIEEIFGERLAWERLDEKRASRLAVYRENTAITSSLGEMGKLEDWIIKTLPKFYKSIALRFSDALKSVAEH